MRRAVLWALFFLLAAGAALAVPRLVSRELGRKVVVVDSGAVASAEKKRIFSRMLRGEISEREAERSAGRFSARFGEALYDYGRRGYLVLEKGAVLSGGRDATEEVAERLAELEEGK